MERVRKAGRRLLGKGAGVKTRQDEEDWERAKSLVEEQYGEVQWPVVQHIFQQMKRARGKRGK